MPELTLPELAAERFVSLTTFRRNGKPVPTPVWVAADGDGLIVTTPSGSGKVKRLRRTSRVELRPCDRRGKVMPGAGTVVAEASVDDDPGRERQLRDRFREKYRLEYRLTMLIERIARRGPAARVIVRVRPAPAAAES